MIQRSTISLLLLLALSSHPGGTPSYGQNPSFLKEGELVFASAGGRVVSKIDIEIAETEDERMTGLMYRTELRENQGMLFIFPNEELHTFWMKNTLLSLDILFVSTDGVIVTIQHDTVPHSEASIPSLKPAKYVVEVNAGYARKFAIHIGDKIYWQRMS